MKKQKRKGRQFNLIVLPADLKLWRERAEASHMTLSEWVRARLLEPDTNSAEAAGDLLGEVVLAEVLALRTLFLNLRPLPGHDLPGEGEVRAEIARVDATKMQRARERLAAQKKASEAAR